jgi:TPR repeat protein
VLRPDRTFALVALLGVALAGSALAASVKPWAAPQPGPELQAALDKAQAGEPADLVAKADAGDAEAQYYAGVLYLFGRPNVPRDPKRGCDYEEKASATRPDAMHLVGLCHQNGAGPGEPVDKVKAETAFTRAAEMGFTKSKCALGQMLMADGKEAQRGINLCRQAANDGDLDAQTTVAKAYFSGSGVRQDYPQARKFYELAAQQGNVDSMRRLGEMYAKGDGGKKDTKKAMEWWTKAEKAGDPLVSILVADQMFSDITGGKKPGPGQYAFKGGVPTSDIEVVEQWYKQAAERDPRPDVKQRAEYAMKILASLKSGGAAAATASSANTSATVKKKTP